MQNINEELQRMLNLTKYKRGVVVSEQTYGQINAKDRDGEITVPDANGKSRGVTSLSSTSLSKNVGFNGEKYDLKFYRGVGKNVGKVTPPTPPTEIPGIEIPTIPTVVFVGNDLPYPDNFITPQFDLYPNANDKIDNFVNIISEYIKKAGGSSGDKIKFFDLLNNKLGKPILIKGTADANPPTWDVPSEMRKKGYSKIDHDYGGNKDLSKMNLYLAEQRAIKFGDELANRLSEKTGISATLFKQYMDFSGYSFYGTGKLGKKSIEVSIEGNIPGGKIKTGSTIIPGKEGEYVPPTSKEITIDFKSYGGEVVKGKTIFDDKGHEFNALPVNTVKELMSKGIIVGYEPNKQFNNNPSPEFKIKGDNIYLDNINFGELVPSSEVLTDPFGVYASNPGVYSVMNRVQDGYVAVYPLYLVLTK